MRLKIDRENASKILALGQPEEVNANLTGFLTTRSRKDIEDKINENSLDSLWKLLLIQSIHFLRINDCRERAFLKNRDGLWNLENKTTMDIPRAEEAAELNAYGIEELHTYFSQFTKFETILYGAETHYRDHLLHPIYVWLLGIKILEEFADKFTFRCAPKMRINATSASADPAWSCFKQQQDLLGRPDTTETKHVDSNNGKNSSEDYSLQVSAAELGAMWTIIALTHDLGYPLEKVERVNDQLEQMLGTFGHIGFARSTFQFASQHDHLVQMLLNIISSNLELKSQGEWRTRVRSKYHAKFARSWESFDHGIVSSLILLRALTFFLETDIIADDRKLLSNEDARQFAIRSEIMHAIAAHTVPKVYHLSAFTLPFLLILSDDLQEWGRPTMADMKAGDLAGSAQSVEFSIDVANAKTKIECTVTHSDCAYKAQRKHVLRVFKTWHERLRPALDDLQRNMRLSWYIKFGDSAAWSLIIDTSNAVFDIVTARGPKEESRSETEVMTLYE